MVEREDHSADGVDSGRILHRGAGLQISAGSHCPARTVFHDRAIHHHAEAPELMRLTIHLRIYRAIAERESDMHVVALMGELCKRRDSETLPLREVCRDA